MSCRTCQGRGFYDDGGKDWCDHPCPDCGEMNWLRKRLDIVRNGGQWTEHDKVRDDGKVLVPKVTLYDTYCAADGVTPRSQASFARWLFTMAPGLNAGQSSLVLADRVGGERTKVDAYVFRGVEELRGLALPTLGVQSETDEVAWMRKKMEARQWTEYDRARGDGRVNVPAHVLYMDYRGACGEEKARSRSAFGRWLTTVLLGTVGITTITWREEGAVHSSNASAYILPGPDWNGYATALAQLTSKTVEPRKPSESNGVLWLRLVQKSKCWTRRPYDQRKDDEDAVIVKKIKLYESYQRVGRLSYNQFLAWFRGVVPYAAVQRRWAEDTKTSSCYRIPDPELIRIEPRGGFTMLAPSQVRRELETGFKQFYLSGHRHRVAFQRVWRGCDAGEYLGFDKRLGYVRVTGKQGTLCPYTKAAKLLRHWGYPTWNLPSSKRK